MLENLSDVWAIIILYLPSLVTVLTLFFNIFYTVRGFGHLDIEGKLNKQKKSLSDQLIEVKRENERLITEDEDIKNFLSELINSNKLDKEEIKEKIDSQNEVIIKLIGKNVDLKAENVKLKKENKHDKLQEDKD